MSTLISPCFFGVTDKNDAYQVSYEITNLCNLECAHCMNESSKHSNPGLPLEEAKQLIDNLVSINLSHIYLTGGEPTVYPYFNEVMEYINCRNIDLYLATNGYAIGDFVETIEKYAKGVFISLDGMAEKHDLFRKKEGSFEKTAKSIELLTSRNIPTRISTVVWKGNIDELEQLIRYCRDIGTYQIHFTLLVNYGRARSNDVEFDRTNYGEIINKLEELKKAYSSERFIVSYRRGGKLNSSCEDCYAGQKMIHINYKGEIHPCSWLAKSSVSSKFSALWKHGNIKECMATVKSFRSIIDQRKEQFGFSGCPAMAELTFDNILEEDPLNQLFGLK